MRLCVIFQCLPMLSRLSRQNFCHAQPNECVRYWNTTAVYLLWAERVLFIFTFAVSTMTNTRMLLKDEAVHSFVSFFSKAAQSSSRANFVKRSALKSDLFVSLDRNVGNLPSSWRQVRSISLHRSIEASKHRSIGH